MRRYLIPISAILLGLLILLPMTEAAENAAADSLRSASSSISHFKLKGTFFTRSLKPLAVIEDTRTGRSIMYETGDILEKDLRITYISRGEVGLRAKKSDYLLSFPKGGLLHEPTPGQEDERWFNIKKEGNAFIVDKDTVSGAIGRVKSIMQNVRIRPHFIDGRRSGIKVTRLAEIGILKESGVKQGDIIRSINSLKVNSPYQIFSAYRSLKDNQELKVDIIRDDKPLTLTYQIKKNI